MDINEVFKELESNAKNSTEYYIPVGLKYFFISFKFISQN